MSGLGTWGGSHTFAARRLVEPRTVDELIQIVRGADRAHAIGTRHSFNSVGDTDGVMICLERMTGEVEIDLVARTAWVPAGVTYATLSVELARYGLALTNLGSLPHISVAGACAVGTHGSGDRNPVLSAAVSGLELVTSDGKLRRVLAGEPDFDGMVIALGALGVVVRLQLDLVPAFELRQDAYLGLAWDALAEHVDDVFGAGYSVSVFATSWAGEAAEQVWVKSAGPDAAQTLLNAPRASTQVAPLGDPEDATEQGAVGSWADRLPHLRRDRILTAGAEIQSEYFVARADATAALQALRGVASAVDPVLAVSELRSIAGDDLWLSPARGRDSIAFHFTWHPRPDEVWRAVGAIEAALAPFAPRPHWGKWFGMPAADIRAVTPGAAAFADLRARLDERDVFRNAYLERTLGL